MASSTSRAYFACAKISSKTAESVFTAGTDWIGPAEPNLTNAHLRVSHCISNHAVVTFSVSCREFPTPSHSASFMLIKGNGIHKFTLLLSNPGVLVISNKYD